MVMIKGITIQLMEQVKTGTDPFGKPIYENKPVDVENVLVSPTSSDDIINQQSLTGKVAVYTLAIPKGDTHEWEDKEVIFFGKRWKTFGFPTGGIDELIPLDWNMKVMVERYG